MFDIIR